MITRTFEFSEGTSDKFWTITLDGRSHTVHFGRIGAAGQTQTKEFASEAEAQKSYDELVAEEVKKGYVEKGGSGGTSAVPAASKTTTAAAPAARPARHVAPGNPAPSTPVPESSEQAQPLPVATAVAATPTSPAPTGEFQVRRAIELDFWAFSYVPARRAAPSRMAPAEPFNLEECLTRLRTKLPVRSYGRDWDFSRAIPDRPLAPEEAEFWLTAMTPRGGTTCRWTTSPKSWPNGLTGVRRQSR